MVAPLAALAPVAGRLLSSLTGGTKVQTTQSVAQSTNVVASPVVAVTTGQGEASPTGGGSASGAPSLSASPGIGGDSLGYPSDLLGTSSPAGGYYPSKFADINPPASPKIATAGFDPLIMLALGAVALVMFTGGKKGK